MLGRVRSHSASTSSVDSATRAVFAAYRCAVSASMAACSSGDFWSHFF
jgi:hypothetical protein